MYMDGIGVRQRTQELTGKMWAALPHAIFGIAGVLGALGLLAMVWLMPMPPGRSISLWVEVVLTAVALFCLPFGAWLWWEFESARCALLEHTQRMNEETIKYGRGWAHS